MGGYGSGRRGYWYKRRPMAECSLAWPIGTLSRSIKLVMKGRGAQNGLMQWSWNGQRNAAVNWVVTIRDNTPMVILTYYVGKKPIRDVIRIGSTPSNLGYGVRWWWMCQSCGRRAGILYAPGDYWRCRHCWRITYRSSNASDKRVSALLDTDVHGTLDALFSTEAGLAIPTRELLPLFKACRILERRLQRKQNRALRAQRSRRSRR